MTKPISSAPSHPDTSPQAIARVLREAIEELEPCAEGFGWLTLERMTALADALDATPQRCTRCHGWHSAPWDTCDVVPLADALDRQPAPMTWEERVERVAMAIEETDYAEQSEYSTIADAALRAGAPELAPSDDP
jgi:hypothetical protein